MRTPGEVFMGGNEVDGQCLRIEGNTRTGVQPDGGGEKNKRPKKGGIKGLPVSLVLGERASKPSCREKLR